MVNWEDNMVKNNKRTREIAQEILMMQHMYDSFYDNPDRDHGIYWSIELLMGKAKAEEVYADALKQLALEKGHGDV
jgi:hypothetical protein